MSVLKPSQKWFEERWWKMMTAHFHHFHQQPSINRYPTVKHIKALLIPTGSTHPIPQRWRIPYWRMPLRPWIGWKRSWEATGRLKRLKPLPLRWCLRDLRASTWNERPMTHRREVIRGDSHMDQWKSDSCGFVLKKADLPIATAISLEDGSRQRFEINQALKHLEYSGIVWAFPYPSSVSIQVLFKSEHFPPLQDLQFYRRRCLELAEEAPQKRMGMNGLTTPNFESSFPRPLKVVWSSWISDRYEV